MVLPSTKYLVLVTKLNFVYKIILKYNPTHINLKLMSVQLICQEKLQIVLIINVNILMMFVSIKYNIVLCERIYTK